MSSAVGAKTTNQDNWLRQRPTNQHDKPDTHVIERVKSFKVNYGVVLNSTMFIYKYCLEEIDLFKEKAMFDKFFWIRGMAAEYNPNDEILSEHIHGAGEIYEPLIGAKMLTTEEEEVIAF